MFYALEVACKVKIKLGPAVNPEEPHYTAV